MPLAPSPAAWALLFSPADARPRQASSCSPSHGRRYGGAVERTNMQAEKKVGVPSRDQYSPYIIKTLSYCSAIGLLVGGGWDLPLQIGIRRPGSARYRSHHTDGPSMCLVTASDENSGPGSAARK